MSKREGENPRRVRAEQLAGMSGCRLPRRGEPRRGESSRPYSQLKQKGRRETGPFVLVANNLIMPVMGGLAGEAEIPLAWFGKAA